MSRPVRYTETLYSREWIQFRNAMELTLFQSTFLGGLLFAALGAIFALPNKPLSTMIRGFPRSRFAAKRKVYCEERGEHGLSNTGLLQSDSASSGF